MTSMTLLEKKEANRRFWMAKGCLIPEGWTDREITEISAGLFNNMWGNHEASIHEAGFEHAWNQRTMLFG